MVYKISRKNKILISWLLTYCVVIAISFVSVFAAYIVNKENVKNECEKNNELLINTVQSEGDKVFQSIDEMAVAMSKDLKVKDITCNYNRMTDEARFALSKIPGVMSLYAGNSKLSSGCYLYFGALDKVSSVNETFDIIDWYNKIGLDIQLERWKDIVSNDTGNWLMKLPSRNGGYRYVYVLRSFYTRCYGVSNLSLVYILKNTDFGFIDSGKIDNMNFYIINADRPVLLHESFALDEKKITSELQDGIFKQLDRKHIYSSCISTVWNVKYVLVSDEDAVFAPIKKLRTICIIISLIGLLVGFSLAYLFANDSFDSIKKISDSLAVYTNDGDSINNLRKLSACTVNMMQDYKKLVDDNIKKQEKIQNGFIKSLLHSDYENNEKLIEQMKAENISFLSDKFAILLIQLQENKNLFIDNSIILNFIYDACSGRHSTTVVEENGFFVCLINFNDEIDNKTLKNEIVEMKNMICNLSQNGKYVELSFAGSQIVSGMDKICLAFREALSVMDYKYMTGKTDILFMSDIKEFDESTGVCYTLEQEKNFIKAIVMGRSDFAVNIVSDVMKTVSENISLRRMGYKYFAYDIINSMMKAASQLGNDALKYMVENNVRFETEINKAECEADYVFMLENSINELCTFAGDKNPIKSLEELVTEIINENYSYSELCLNYIAEKLNLHPVYLSSSFKSQFGEGISALTERIRLEKAIGFLEEGESVNSAAKKVGYTNVQTFSRAFKRKYGVAPSAWVRKK